MPRMPRPEFPNGLYHVMNRGVEQRSIVHDDRDRQEWFRSLSRVVRRYEWRVFAYVLLNNHFHLFFRIRETNLSAGMHNLESAYATFFNGRYERIGHLFQGRFKSIVVEDESYSWQLSRYVHLNPVRAGLVNDPLQYRWCSYRFYLNPHGAPAWLDWRTVLAEFGRSEAAARVAYKRFVDAGVQHPPANPLDAAVDGWILGSDEFVQRVRAACDAPPKPETTTTQTIDDVVSAVCRVFRVSREHVRRRGGRLNRAREAAVWLARELSGETNATLGEAFGVGATSVTETARRAERRLAVETQFRDRVELVRQTFRE